ncbi:hypothetical protein [Methylobacterium haplocladii]|uniref:Uncharacterized protein n=1 Tax=Methylobacterium haplocladii TaxID=1176176 RepID=A0A512IMM9_9HYPH|nr:hypothetical protein [Methylobacterium haplocladii]GEO98931.1 hypothetical protein MHA02_13190 [Methylobacterium haplocladii]GJD85268.1 hypothetical protein HPGCJGGD_3155 [Methylobacterium haplocladii]GLS58079.1 hypothetical protein GCM10007887_07350 [Methylobacterium haplocladii]
MSDEDEITRTMLVQSRELEAELKRLRVQLMPNLLKRLSNTAAHVEAFDGPSPDRIGGTLLHAARCIDAAGARLRDALGASLRTTDPAEPAPPEATPLPILLQLDHDPDPAEVAALGLEPVFVHGRWRPCALYSGTVAPEQLAPLVLRYGGDCRVLQRQKRMKAGHDG